MERRDLIRALGAAAALTLLPRDALATWSRVATGLRPANGLNDAQMALVRAIADTILPRTDTPSATDVGVHGFVDVIVAEHATDEERTAFLADLEAIDRQAIAAGGVVFADLPPSQKAALIDALEQGKREEEPKQTYWRLKGLVVHGYFTSEPVMKNVLKHTVMPGKFEGDAPILMPRPMPAPKPGEPAHLGAHR